MISNHSRNIKSNASIIDVRTDTACKNSLSLGLLTFPGNWIKTTFFFFLIIINLFYDVNIFDKHFFFFFNIFVSLLYLPRANYFERTVVVICSPNKLRSLQIQTLKAYRPLETFGTVENYSRNFSRVFSHYFFFEISQTTRKKKFYLNPMLIDV